jgi:hypothetical protein
VFVESHVLAILPDPPAATRAAYPIRIIKNAYRVDHPGVAAAAYFKLFKQHAPQGEEAKRGKRKAQLGFWGGKML